MHQYRRPARRHGHHGVSTWAWQTTAPSTSALQTSARPTTSALQTSAPTDSIMWWQLFIEKRANTGNVRRIGLANLGSYNTGFRAHGDDNLGFHARFARNIRFAELPPATISALWAHGRRPDRVPAPEFLATPGLFNSGRPEGINVGARITLKAKIRKTRRNAER